MPLLELTLRRQDARDAERDIAMMQMVNAGAAPLTGSKVGEEIFVTTLRRLQRIAHGLPPQPEGSTAFQRLLDHALSQQGAQSAKRT